MHADDRRICHVFVTAMCGLVVSECMLPRATSSRQSNTRQSETEQRERSLENTVRCRRRIILFARGGEREINIEADPCEENNVIGTSAWVIGPYLKVIGDYLKTLEQYPNPKPVNLTEFGK